MDYQLIITCLAVGYVFGISTGLFFKPENYKTERIISLLVFTVWLSGNIVSISYGMNGLPRLFDIIGAGAVGNLAGLNLISLIKSFKNEK